MAPQFKRRIRRKIRRRGHQDELTNHQNPTQQTDADHILHLQQTIGNQAVMRMLENNTIQRGLGKRSSTTQPQLRVANTPVQRNPLKNFAADQIFGSKKERTKTKHDKSITSLLQKTNIGSIDEVNIQSTDDVMLRGRFYHASDSAKQHGDATGKTVLFLSGSAGTAENYGADIAHKWTRRGADVLAVNYRGFGKSKKQIGNKEKSIRPTEQGLYDDARSMFTWLAGQEGVGAGNVIVHGYSLGGAVAASLVADLAEDGIAISGLLMHSPMQNTKDPAGDVGQEMLGATGRKLAKWFAGKSGAALTTDDKFARIAEHMPGLATLFISGTKKDGDQLALGHTHIDDSAREAGMTNVSSHQARGGHEDTAQHMELGTDNAYDKITEFLAGGTPEVVGEIDEILN